MNSIICCIAKLEEDYIKEWILYHLDIGFSKVVIFDNNELYNKDSLENSLADFVRNGSLQIINYLGLKAAQITAYRECFDNFDFDWCAFIDCDEFITFSNKSGFNNINDYLQTIDSTYDIIHVNWMCYGDNNLIYKKKGSVQERFTNPIMPFNWKNINFEYPHNYHIKSLIRKNADILWFDCTPHTPLVNKSFICDADGIKITDNSPFYKYTFQTMYIRHYATKSLFEFMEQKLIRQAADSYSKKLYSLRNYYFYNEKTNLKCFVSYCYLLKLFFVKLNNICKYKNLN